MIVYICIALITVLFCATIPPTYIVYGQQVDNETILNASTGDVINPQGQQFPEADSPFMTPGLPTWEELTVEEQQQKQQQDTPDLQFSKNLAEEQEQRLDDIFRNQISQDEKLEEQNQEKEERLEVEQQIEQELDDTTGNEDDDDKEETRQEEEVGDDKVQNEINNNDIPLELPIPFP